MTAEGDGGGDSSPASESQQQLQQQQHHQEKEQEEEEKVPETPTPPALGDGTGDPDEQQLLAPIAPQISEPAPPPQVPAPPVPVTAPVVDPKLCPVCFEQFTRRKRTPIGLLCGHTFCAVCVRGLAQSGNEGSAGRGISAQFSLTCGVCRAVTFAHPQKLRKNVMLLELLDEKGDLVDTDDEEEDADGSTNNLHRVESLEALGTNTNGRRVNGGVEEEEDLDLAPLFSVLHQIHLVEESVAAIVSARGGSHNHQTLQFQAQIGAVRQSLDQGWRELTNRSRFAGQRQQLNAISARVNAAVEAGTLLTNANNSNNTPAPAPAAAAVNNNPFDRQRLWEEVLVNASGSSSSDSNDGGVQRWRGGRFGGGERGAFPTPPAPAAVERSGAEAERRGPFSRSSRFGEQRGVTAGEQQHQRPSPFVSIGRDRIISGGGGRQMAVPESSSSSSASVPRGGPHPSLLHLRSGPGPSFRPTPVVQQEDDTEVVAGERRRPPPPPPSVRVARMTRPVEEVEPTVALHRLLSSRPAANNLARASPTAPTPPSASDAVAPSQRRAARFERSTAIAAPVPVPGERRQPLPSQRRPPPSSSSLILPEHILLRRRPSRPPPDASENAPPPGRGRNDLPEYPPPPPSPSSSSNRRGPPAFPRERPQPVDERASSERRPHCPRPRQ